MTSAGFNSEICLSKGGKAHIRKSNEQGSFARRERGARAIEICSFGRRRGVARVMAEAERIAQNSENLDGNISSVFYVTRCVDVWRRSILGLPLFFADCRNQSGIAA